MSARLSLRAAIRSAASCIALACLPAAANAAIFSAIESQPVSELWLNPGFWSYHFQRDKGLNGNDFGLGAEYRYSTVSSVTLGFFDNSNRKTSHYAGWYWQPVALGPVRLGAVFGAIDGYPDMQNGGWFAAAIPTASFEYGNLGVNLLFVPSYQNRLYGALSFQFKLRVF